MGLVRCACLCASETKLPYLFAVRCSAPQAMIMRILANASLATAAAPFSALACNV